jgi:hypothetical protein
LEFRRLIQSHDRLCQCAGVIFSLAAQLFDAQIPIAARPLSTDALTPAMALWVERYGVRSAIGNFSTDKFSLFLHRLFINSPAGWTEVRSRRLFPFRKPHLAVSLEGIRGRRRWRALRKQAIHSGRRLWFHLAAGVRYLLEIPFWSFRIRTMSGQGSLQPAHGITTWPASAGIVGGVKE